MSFFRSSLLAVTLGLSLAACGSSQKPAPVAPVAKPGPAPVADDTDAPPVTAEVTAPIDEAAPKDPIYFEFDSATIRDDSRATLEKLAAYLDKHPSATVTITGHTDDRGTVEYNLALGDQRAKATRDYLVRLGVDAARLRVLSYGEERPAVTGTSEDAWAKNRRAELETTK